MTFIINSQKHDLYHRLQLVATIERQLKAQGLTCRDVAGVLDLSEPSVKRLFGNQGLSLERLS